MTKLPTKPYQSKEKNMRMLFRISLACIVLGVGLNIYGSLKTPAPRPGPTSIEREFPSDPDVIAVWHFESGHLADPNLIPDADLSREFPFKSGNNNQSTE